MRWRRLSMQLTLPLLIGLAAALAAQAFVAAVVRLNDWLLVTPDARLGADADLLIVATLAVPTLAGLAVGLLRRIARADRLQGPPEVIAAVQTRGGGITPGAGPASATGALLSLGGGAAVGEYGPLVHAGGSLGSWMARLLNADLTTVNNAIACGVAAAIATIFNAPLAGILFAHEIILRHFSPRAFAPVAVSALVGYIVGNALRARQPMLEAAGQLEPGLWEFSLFVVLGVAGAGLALAFMHAVLGTSRLAARVRRFEFAKPALAGLLLGAAALALPEVLGMGFELLRDVIDSAAAPSIAALALVLVARLAATAISLGLGFVGGVFAPAMVIGALFGAIFGAAATQWLGLPIDHPTAYAICGMVAVTAPVIGAPVTAVVIVLELTGSYPLTLAALASVSVANLIVARLFGRGLFDHQLKQRRIDLSAGRSKAILEARTIDPLVETEGYVAVDPGTDAAATFEQMAAARRSQAFLVDAAGVYQGSVQLKDLAVADPGQQVVELRNRDDIVMLHHLSIWRAMYRIRRFDGECVAIVDDRGRLVGALYAANLIENYLDVQSELRGEEQLRAE